MSNLNNRKFVIVTLITIAVVGVFSAKLYIEKGANDEIKQSFATIAPGQPAVYLFYDAVDQDESCRAIYEAFDLARASFPDQIQSSKIDVYEDETLFHKFGVRVLPTVLFVDGKGEEKERIEGEGKEVERLLASAFTSVQDILMP